MAHIQRESDPERSAETAELIEAYHDLTRGIGDPADVLAPDVLLHEADQGQTRKGIEAVTAEWDDFMETFEGWSVEVHEIVAQPGTAASRWSVSGRLTGEIEGVEPSGQRLEQTGLTMFVVENGLVAEIWDRVDTYGMRKQLGIIE